MEDTNKRRLSIENENCFGLGRPHAYLVLNQYVEDHGDRAKSRNADRKYQAS